MTVDLATFCRAPLTELADVGRGAVAVMGVRDAHVGRTSRQAAEAIRRASIATFDVLAPGSRLVDIDTGRSLVRTSRLVDLGDFAKAGSPVDRIVESVVLAGAVPVVLGSERSPTKMGFSGFCRASGSRQERVGLVCLAPDLDVVFEVQPSTPSEQVAADPVLLDPVVPTKTAVLGVHGLVPHRYWREASGLGVAVVRSSTARADIEAAAREVLVAATTETDVVFVAVDLGVVDLGHAPGRIGAKIAGLEASELLDLCAVLSSANIAGVVLGGLAADLDQTDRSAALAAQIVVELIAPLAFSDRAPTSRSASHAVG